MIFRWKRSYGNFGQADLSEAMQQSWAFHVATNSSTVLEFAV